MKVNAIGHPKLNAFQARLGCSLPAIIGHLELLWLFTAKHAPAGDVGKWSNFEIAAACFWGGDADAFVTAAVESRWIDASATHRLVIHDWEEHCPNYVRAKLRKSNADFAKPNLSGDLSPLLSADLRADLSGDSLSQVKSSLVKPRAIAPKTAPRERDEVWEGVLEACGIQAKGPMTSSQRGAFNRAVGEIRRVLREGGMPLEEIGRRAALHRNLWPKASLTPTSLARHWGELIAAPMTARAPDKTAAQVASEKLATDLRLARIEASRYGLRKQMQGEADENFISRIHREGADVMLAQATKTEAA